MVKYIVKRILLSILILFGVSLIIYFLMRLLPDNYIDKMFRERQGTVEIPQEVIDQTKALLGIADNSFWGIIKGYFKWIGSAIKGDFGLSFLYQAPVMSVIFKNMGVSFMLAVLAEVFRYLLAIPLGIKTARKQYGAADYTVTTAAMIGISLPSFFLAAILIKFFAVDLGIFPVNGLVDATIVGASPIEVFFDQLHHLILPMLTVVLLGTGGLMRYTRTNTLEVLNADYIRTARAKGLSEKVVVNKHAFRNTLIPIVTMMAGTIPGLFGGAMILEKVFAIPGVGLMAYDALIAGDIPFVMGYNMFLAVLSVIGTLMSDLMYVIVDPRIKITR